MIEINYKEYDAVLAKRIEDIWDITHRAGRKHKIYQKSVTNEFRGFRNEYNRNYCLNNRLLHYKCCSSIIYVKFEYNRFKNTNRPSEIFY